MFDESLLFNIIYTPNTVVRFLPFIKTLLNKSNLSFRLVSNGCSLPERKFLKIFCSKEKRLEYLSYPSIAIEEHGKVLNYLQALDKNRKYFCFIDSDIFATDNFENFFDDLFKDERLTAIFSGAPVWLKKSELIAPDNLKFLAGYYHWNEDNLCHGSTYFAIYRNNILNKLIQDTAIGFEIHKFEYLPQDIQDILLKMNMKKVMYDTAKVLNLLINYKGFKSQYIDITDLIHIGSLSFHAKNQITKIENTLKVTQIIFFLTIIIFYLKNVNSLKTISVI